MSAKTIRPERLSQKNKPKKVKPNSKKKEARPSPLPKFLKTWGFPGAGVLFLALGLIFMHDLITQTTYFQVRSIEVLGTSHLDERKILDQAAIPENSNLLGLNLRLLRLRLEAHPWVQKAALNRKLPGTLEIKITEETPFASLSPPLFITEKAFWADREGRIFKEVEREDPEGYPTIRGLPLPNPKDTDLWFSRVRNLLDLLQEELEMGDDNTFSFWIDPDLGLGLSDTPIATNIFFGFSNYEEKALRLRTLLRHRREQNHTEPMDSIDLGRPDRVIVIPAAA